MTDSGDKKTLIYVPRDNYEENIGGTGFQPVLAQAKACGYTLLVPDRLTTAQKPTGHYWGQGGFPLSSLK
jgi:hypothetical protein